MPRLTVSEAMAALGAFIPFEKSAGWDVAGLQLGDSMSAVDSIAVCHEVTEAVVARVEAQPPSLLITYHPLLFRPTRMLVGGRSPAGRALRLIQSRTALLVAHTAWDVARGGAADALAAALGIADPAPFGASAGAEQVKIVTFAPEEHIGRLVAAMSDAGGGTIGSYEGCHFVVGGEGGFIAGESASPAVGETGANVVPEKRLEMIAPAGRREAVVASLVATHPYEEPAFDVYAVESNAAFIGRLGALRTSLSSLAATVETVLESPVRVAGDGDRALERVAVAPGSGGSYVGAAAGAGAQAIVTGDVGHHTMVEASDRGMAVIDAGHVATERPGMTAMVDTVRKAFSDQVSVLDYLDLDPSPWR